MPNGGDHFSLRYARLATACLPVPDISTRHSRPYAGCGIRATMPSLGLSGMNDILFQDCVTSRALEPTEIFVRHSFSQVSTNKKQASPLRFVIYLALLY